ncbi:MAG: hypothetical protein ABWY79_04635 [Solirubrobacterales bacterium]
MPVVDAFVVTAASVYGPLQPAAGGIANSTVAPGFASAPRTTVALPDFGANARSKQIAPWPPEATPVIPTAPAAGATLPPALLTRP